MQGVPAWHKFKNHAAIFILRWSSDFADEVWQALTSKIDATRGAETVNGEPYIALAIRVAHQQEASYERVIREITGTFNVTEQQIWALLIDRSAPEVVDVDVLSDAHDHIQRLGAAVEARDTATLHVGFAADAKHRGTQREKAKLPRNSEVDAMIKALATDTRYRDHSAKELHPIFIRRLEAAGASPEEVELPDGRTRIIYLGRRGERSMLGETFAKKVSSFRVKPKK